MNHPRGNKATVNGRVYVQHMENISVFEQHHDFMVFLHAFSTMDTDAAFNIIVDLRASGCTGAGCEEGGKKA